jgi:hypothetical protein
VELLGVLTPLAGIALFVLVRGYLNGFYGRLGVDPDDVGLGYGATLGSSIGLLVFFTLAAVVLPAVLLTCGYAAVRVARSTESLPLRRLPSAIGSATLHFLRRTLPFGALASLAIFATLFSGRAEYYAKAVQNGQPIRFGALSLTSFKVRATPMRVRSTGRPAENPGVEDVARRSMQSPPLLYLGQADGIVVAYDSVMQQVIRLPASTVLLRLANCEVMPTVDPACRRAID